jgi:hypothetical protein
LALWTGVLLEDPFLTIEDVSQLIAHPLDTLRYQFSHLSRKNEHVSPPDGTPHTKP